MNNKSIILQTALELFGEQGYDRTPTSQVAKQAGVSEGLVFKHYGNKAGLLKAIIEDGMAQISDSMKWYAEQSDRPRHVILQHIERSLTAVRAQEKFWRLATRIRFQAEVHGAAAAQIEDSNQFIIKHLTENFRRIGTENPEQQALLLFAQIDGICLHWLQNPAHYPLEKMKQLLMKQYTQVYF